jgi:hypothetical protein
MKDHEMVLCDSVTGEVLEVIKGIYWADGKGKVTRWLNKNGYSMGWISDYSYDDHTCFYVNKI